MRGRKRIEDGGKRSPHKKYCVCIAKDPEKGLIHAEILIPGDESPPKEELIEAASIIFEQEHGISPDNVYGPYRLYKGILVNQKKKEESLDINLEDVVLIQNKKASGIYDGWNVSIRFIQDHDDLGYIVFKSLLDQNNVRKNPGIKIVNLNQINNLIEE
jgi:hypothetical protein